VELYEGLRTWWGLRRRLSRNAGTVSAAAIGQGTTSDTPARINSPALTASAEDVANKIGTLGAA
jgi:hypothetical protein